MGYSRRFQIGGERIFILSRAGSPAKTLKGNRPVGVGPPLQVQKVLRLSLRLLLANLYRVCEVLTGLVDRVHIGDAILNPNLIVQVQLAL